MTPDAYFTSIITILTGLIFIALVLGFLYMVYGKEETPEEEEEQTPFSHVTNRDNKRTVKAVDNRIVQSR